MELPDILGIASTVYGNQMIHADGIDAMATPSSLFVRHMLDRLSPCQRHRGPSLQAIASHREVIL